MIEAGGSLEFGAIRCLRSDRGAEFGLRPSYCLRRNLQPFTGIGVVERTNARRNLQPFTGIGVVERTNARRNLQPFTGIGVVERTNARRNLQPSTRIGVVEGTNARFWCKVSFCKFVLEALVRLDWALPATSC
eukprot:s347_g11.t1